MKKKLKVRMGIRLRVSHSEYNYFFIEFINIDFSKNKDIVSQFENEPIFDKIDSQFDKNPLKSKDR